MEELVQLIDVLNRSASKVNISKICRRGSKEAALVTLIGNKSVENDHDAAQALYSCQASNYKYKMLKHRVKSKLYEALLLFDYESSSRLDYQMEHLCQQLLLQASVMYRNQRYHLAVGLAKRVIDISVQFSFTNYEILAYEQLLACYTITAKNSLYEKAVQKHNVLLSKKIAERKAQNIYQSVRISFQRSVKQRRESISGLESKVKEVEELWKSAETSDSFNAYYKLSMLYFESIGNYERILSLTIMSEQWLADGLLNSHRFEGIYNKYILVYAHLRLQKYEQGLSYAELYLNSFSPKTTNWFSFNENYLLLAIHSKNYSLANVILHRVFSNGFFPNISKGAKERWTLYQAYFKLINNEEKSQATLNPFLLSLPEYSKDKQGFNVAILILQFIHYLQRRETEALLYRIESLKKYILTHLRDSFSVRSKSFLKLLILTVTEDYDAVACRKKGEKLYQKLIETPTPGDAFAEIEIVPYEHLWEHILDTLQTHYR